MKKYKKSYDLQLIYNVVVHNNVEAVQTLLDNILDSDHIIQGCYPIHKEVVSYGEVPYGEGDVMHVTALDLTLNMLNPIKTYQTIRRIKSTVNFALKFVSDTTSLAITQDRRINHYSGKGYRFEDV